MLELLVLIACVNNSGCAQTTTAYYSSHPELKRTVKKHELQVKQLVGPGVVMFSPLLMLVGKKRATFNINKYLSLQVSTRQEHMLLFKVTF